MKRLLLLLLLLHKICFAQYNKAEIYKAWVVKGITYKDGSPLPDDNILKYSYVKYTFSKPDVFSYSAKYNERGSSSIFDFTGNEIAIISSAGSLMNTMRVEELSANKLVILQQGAKGFDDPSALKYTFVSEQSYQDAIPLTANLIHSVNTTDTVFKQSPKVYASFGDKSFHSFVLTAVSGSRTESKAAHFLASFIVSKQGIADSVKILESINTSYDKAFLKAFNKTRKDWVPGTINGKNVNVYMLLEVSYLSSDMALPSFTYTQEANSAFAEQSYEKALYYFDKALAKLPTDKENLYKRGICKRMLGNQPGACEDWQKLKQLGGTEADTLLATYCK